jgi:hypothetical protein
VGGYLTNDELERISKEATVLSQHFLEGHRKINKNFSQYSRCPFRDSNAPPPEYKPKAVPNISVLTVMGLKKSIA